MSLVLVSSLSGTTFSRSLAPYSLSCRYSGRVGHVHRRQGVRNVQQARYTNQWPLLFSFTPPTFLMCSSRILTVSTTPFPPRCPYQGTFQVLRPRMQKDNGPRFFAGNQFSIYMPCNNAIISSPPSPPFPATSSNWDCFWHVHIQ